MTIKEAKEILVSFNQWRRGLAYDASIEILSPKHIGIAIDTLVNLQTFSKEDLYNAYKKGYDDGCFDITH
jgi:hypothetical protein